MEIQNGTPSPLARMEQRERMGLLQAALDSLPAEFKMVVALRDVEGLSYEDIAEITGLKLGTVRSRINRGRGHFRAIMEPLLKREGGG